jgi:hypothetical protein
MQVVNMEGTERDSLRLGGCHVTEPSKTFRAKIVSSSHMPGALVGVGRHLVAYRNSASRSRGLVA